MNKITGIYKLESPSGKVYIGQSWNIKQRWYNYRGNDFKKQTKLYASFNKYGAKSHNYEIIHELPADVDQRVMDDYEILYICQYRDCGVRLLNIRDGGSGGRLSEETKKKLSIALTGLKRKQNPNKKRERAPHTEETKNKIAKSNTGYKHTDSAKMKMKEARKHQVWGPCTEEQKKKISAKNKGRKLSDAHIKRVSEANIGNKNCLGYRHTPEALEKMKQAKIGKKQSEETKQKRINSYKATCEKRRVLS